MGLKVWLPLTQDLRNLGTENLPRFSYRNSISFKSDGKINEKAFRGGLGWHLTNDILDNKWTVSAWVKRNSAFASSNNIIFCKNTTNAGDSQIYLSIIDGTRLNLGINSTTYAFAVPYTFNLDTWYHIAATYDGTKASLYINGVLAETKAFSSTKTNALNIFINGRSTSNNGTTMGTIYDYSLNDFRLYDEALSPTEIKEISRGLVRHYKFDNTNIIDSSLNNINGTTTGTLTTSTDSGRYSNSLVFSGNQRIEADSLPSETKTISFWIKTNSVLDGKVAFVDKNSNFACGFYSNNLIVYCNNTDAGSTGSYVKLGKKYITNDWNHIVIIKTADKTFTTYINNQIAENKGTQCWIHNLDNLTFGCRYGTIVYQYYFNGQLSDFRAYATQLSEADILELYKMGAKIDSKNKFHTYEVVENQPITKITKQGQVKVLEVNENNKINFDETGDLNTFEIIEV